MLCAFGRFCAYFGCIVLFVAFTSDGATAPNVVNEVMHAFPPQSSCTHDSASVSMSTASTAAFASLSIATPQVLVSSQPISSSCCVLPSQVPGKCEYAQPPSHLLDQHQSRLKPEAVPAVAGNHLFLSIFVALPIFLALL